MSQESFTRADAVFRDALALEGAERARFLDASCEEEPELRRTVEELLRLAIEPAPGLEPGVLIGGPLFRAALEDTPDDDLTTGATVGAWRIVRELGRGGMATVYLVERTDREFEQRGALKLVRSHAGSDEIARRLQRERRILAALTHPGIARLLDGGQTADGRPYFVMDFVEGRTIDRYSDAQQLTADERVDLFLRVCRAVQYAHRQLIVHGDVKPANIIVTDDGNVRLLDFGIARLLSAAQVEDGDGDMPASTRALTPAYASPEQVRGEPVAIASDVYQLGLVLYELLTGARAQEVSEPTPAALARAVCETMPSQPSARVALTSDHQVAARRTTPGALARKLRGDIDSITMCALTKEPDRRYESVDELLAEIERYRAGLPVQARRGPWSYRAARFVTRHRAALAWATALFVAIALVVPAWAGQRWRAAREAARAEQIETLIESLFAFPHPRVQANPPTGATLLEHAARLVREDLDGQPSSQARLLTLLGRVYNALGHYEPSIDVLEQALQLRRAQLGADSAEVADALEWLGQSQHYSGRYDEAEASVREALALRERHLGRAHPDTVRTAIELGDLLHTRGSLVDAEEVLRAAVEKLRTDAIAARPEDFGHDSLPRAVRDLANVLRDRGLHDEAAAHYQEAIGLFKELHGVPSQQAATSQVYYARLLVMRAEHAAAAAALEEAVATLQHIYDGDHALVGIALRNLGHLRIEQGLYNEAESALDEAQRIQHEWLGPGHPMVARARTHQAELALWRGRVDEAISSARQALEVFDRLGLTDHPSAIDARATLGEALIRRGDREDARRVLAAGLESAVRQFVAGDVRTLRLQEALRTAEHGR